MVLVKICGNTTEEDALNALKFGADLIGVIVEVPIETPRKVNVSKAKKILAKVQGKGVMVIMPKSFEQANMLYQSVTPDYIQLHGNESLNILKKLKKLPCKLIKTIHVSGKDAISDSLRYAPYCDYLLLDTFSLKMGGSGKKHDWDISKEIVEKVNVPVILAGGLNPTNVKGAIKTVKPFAVDVVSGIESSRGNKDFSKVKSFIGTAKQS